MGDLLYTLKMRSGAWPLIALRGAMVAVHLLVMLGLAAWLGLAGFGALAHLWAVALVLSTVIAAGGPLVILRANAATVLARFVTAGVLFPATLAVAGFTVLALLGQLAPWGAVVALAFAFALGQAVASALRVMGSVAFSMVLRDGLPVILLGIVAIVPATTEALIWWVAVALIVVSLITLGVAAVRAGVRWQTDGTAEAQPLLWMSSLLGMAQAQADLVVAGALLPPEVFGVYALLRRIANLVALPVSVATWVCAGPVSNAFAHGNRSALAKASAEASAIAWYPALGLAFCAASGGVIVWQLAPTLFGPQMSLVFAVLLAGALVQAYWAATFPVANLGPAPRMAVEARLLALALYIGLVAVASGRLDALGHAVGYTVAMSVGSLHLWRLVMARFAVDASARSLRVSVVTP